jgi:hypothetical protein
MKVNRSDILIAESWHCITHVTVVNCFQKCCFNVNQTKDGENAAEHSIYENNCGKLKESASFDDDDDDDATCEVQAIEQMKDEKFYT